MDKIDPAEAVNTMGTAVARLRLLAAAFFAADAESGLFAVTKSGDGPVGVTRTSASATAV